MDLSTHTLAETLKPPFIAAIFTDTAIVDHLTTCVRRPSDEMVSLAPVQPGFLGLETTRDENGRWLSVSYWRDMETYTDWRGVCVKRIAEAFPEAPLESLCHIRVANVDQAVSPSRAKHLKADAPVPTSTESAQRSGRLFNVLPTISEFFGHVQIR